MNQRGLLSYNNDLLIMLLMGVGLALSQYFGYELSFHQQLVFAFCFPFIAGLMLTRNGHLFEWCFCFLFGGLIAQLGISIYPMYLQGVYNLDLIAEGIQSTGRWYIFLLGPFILGGAISVRVSDNFFKRYWASKQFY